MGKIMRCGYIKSRKEVIMDYIKSRKEVIMDYIKSF